MNVLFLTQTYPRRAGDTTGPFIRDLARGLVRGGDQVRVLTPHAEGVPAAWDDDGVAVETFRYAPERWELLGYSRSLEADEKPRPAAAAVTPLYLAGLVRAARRSLARQPANVVQAHWIVPNGFAAFGLPRRVPLLAGLHGSDVFLAEKSVVRTAVGRVLARLDGLTGCSPELVDRVCALGFPRERAVVIPYGVDGELFSPDSGRRGIWRARLGVPDDARLLLGLGRMATKKGFDVLLAALPELLARHRDVHVVLAGEGDLLTALRSRAAEMGAERASRVHFPGVVYRDALPDLFRAADIFTLPAVHDSKGNVDGLPNVILEAMATGLPVVATAISGIPLAITDGLHGRLVPERDAPALGAALDELISAPERARQMGAAGRAKALAELSWDVVAGRYRAAYEAAVGRNPESARP
ncbi:MAG: glycosyltransferase [Thermoanaerobaculia bacterium]|nr:glycosyltransferase [Thermoanaerobaculia bacterium]